MSNEMSRYRVVGPRGEGPFEVEAATGLEAASKIQETHRMKARRGRYGLSQPQGRHGAVVGYEPSGNVAAKVGAFDITWLGWVEA